MKELSSRARAALARLRSTDELLSRGFDHDGLAALIRSRSLHRVRQGWYLDAELWTPLTPEERHLVEVVAAHRSADAPPLFSHHAAAVLHRLPLWGLRTTPVHVIADDYRSGHSTTGVRRHRLTVDPADIVTVGGIRCTSPDRTLADLSRIEPPEMTIGCADAILTLVSQHGRALDRNRADAWRAGMLDRLDGLRGVHGVRNLRRVVELADPRSDSPLESLSRLQLHRLGFDVEPQVPVAGPNGRTYFMDFEFLGLDLFGECDGRMKYTDPGMLAGRDINQFIYEEKRREEWVRERERKGVVRWAASEAATADRLAAHLAGLRVPLPPKRHR